MSLSIGQVLNNRYRITKLLGQGGFGAVYRAWDLSLKKPCAVKQNFETSPQAHQQFEREAVILARLHHPNLPRVTDHFTIPEEAQYLVMDFVEGEDLQEILDHRGGPLPESQVLPWIEQVCDALTYLHNQVPPIIHRDIKPANIKVTPQGQAMLVDFGIAKVYDPNLKTTLGARAVTPGFSPLEQYGQGSTDPRSDVYSLGAMLYTLLTARQLPESTQRAVRDTVIPPERLNPSISPPVVAAIKQAIQVDAAHRLQSVSDFKTALLTTQTIVAPPPMAQSAANRYSNLQPTAALRPNIQSAKVGGIPKWLLLAGLGVVGVGIIVVIGLVAFFAGRISEPTPEVIVGVETVVGFTVTAGVPVNTPGLLPTSTPVPVLTNTLIPTVPPTGTTSPQPTFTPTIILSPTPVLPPVMVEAYCNMFGDSPVHVKEHQPVILWWRWDAKTPQLVQDHLDAAHYEVTLDSLLISAERQSDIEYLVDKGWYRVSWFAEARVLPPGTHRSERYLTWDRHVSDGWDTFGPGSKTETEWDYCDIIVGGN
jgi:serine/threonine protein kinase